MKNLESWIESLAEHHQPNFEECCHYLAQYLPLLNRFSDTEQDPQWHAEGNVAIHTNMVLRELYQLLVKDAAYITGAKRQILILSALLHDIAKPLATRRKDVRGIERVVATGHEEQGASYLAIKLLELPLKHEVISTIIGLVGHHQLPKLLVIKNKGYSNYLKLSLDADLELLYWLELADMKGRLCDDLTKQLDLLEQFRMFAEEYNLWSVSKIADMILPNIQVKSEHAEQVYLNGYAVHQLAHGQINMAEEAIAKHYQGGMHYSNLYVMCGISGSGKSTWIDKNLAGFEVISLDEIRTELNGKRSSQKNIGQVLQLAKLRLKTALANKKNVVWDATNLRKDFRDIICDFGRSYHALITLVVFQMKESSLRAGNKNRLHVIGNDIITEQLALLQWPSFNEGHRMLFIGEKGKILSQLGSF